MNIKISVLFEATVSYLAPRRILGPGPKILNSSGSMFSLLGEEHLPAPSMKPFSDLVPDLSRSLQQETQIMITRQDKEAVSGR